MVDINGLKGRIGEALVESILRQSGFKVARLGRESQVQALLKMGRSEFLPDFLVWKPVDNSPDGALLYRLLSVEVKYRTNVEDALICEGQKLISRAGKQWQELYLVFVTDHPALGRSKFQVLDPRQSASDTPLRTIDLHEVCVFEKSKSVIEEHESLVGPLFSQLSTAPRGIDDLRKPLAKLSPDGGGSVQSEPSQGLGPA